MVNGKSIVVGGPRLLTEAKVTVPPEVEKLTSAWASEGKTVLYVVAEGRLLGALRRRRRDPARIPRSRHRTSSAWVSGSR